MPALLSTGTRPRVAVHARIWEPRRVEDADGSFRTIGIPWSPSLLTESGLTVTTVTDAAQLWPGVWSTGTIPNRTHHQPLPRLQRNTAGGWQSDAFPDEQALVLTTEAGLVVCTGCAHAGVVNTILAAQQATGIAQIHALIGGLHLHDCSPEQVGQLADALRSFGIEHLLVNHCTGETACRILQQRLGPNVAWAGAGYRLELPPLIAG